MISRENTLYKEKTGDDSLEVTGRDYDWPMVRVLSRGPSFLGGSSKSNLLCMFQREYVLAEV